MTNLEYIRSAELGKLADLLFDLAGCPCEDLDCTSIDSCRECWEYWLESERKKTMIDNIKMILATQEALREADLWVNTATATVVAKALMERGVSVATDNNVGKWISVSERLPEDREERVLVKINDANSIMGHPDMDTDRYMGEIWVRWGHNVTHWMPLPEPPKEE